MTEMHWFINGEASSDEARNEKFSSHHFLGTVYEAVLEVSEEAMVQSAKSRMLVTLLTYCYARGIYSASMIESATHQDPVVRYICARYYPSAAEIRDFRRYKKDMVIKVLANALEKFSSPRGRQFTALAESERRVANAIQWDSFELDL